MKWSENETIELKRRNVQVIIDSEGEMLNFMYSCIQLVLSKVT